jgi:4-amino-4-deoxy-L-arabinose transferase-like glycosyltransferase
MIESLRRQPQRLFTAVLLPAILVLAAALRFTSLWQRGLLYWDEGKFALEGIRLLGILSNLPSVHAAMLTGKAIGTAKPTHALLIALSYRLLGVHDHAPLAMNAAASVLAVAVLFVLTRRLFDPRVALVAAALLAISGYDIIYARSALSESDANLIFLLGVLLWWRSRESEPESALLRRPWLPGLLTGLVLGIGFTVNYRLSIYIATVVGIDLVMVWRRQGWRVSGIVAAAWGAGLLAAPVAWQLIGLVAERHGIAVFRSEITYRPTTYFSEVIYQMHEGRQSTLQFNPLPYLQWYVVRQGWPVTILLLAGFVYAIRERSPRWLVPAAFVAIPYAVYCFAPLIVPRNLDTALPFAAILSAGAAMQLTELIQVRRLVLPTLAVLTLLLSFLGADSAWALTGVRSGFALAARYVHRHHSDGAIIVNEVMLFYLNDSGRGCDAPELPATDTSLATTLATVLHAGNRYAVIDSYAVPISWYLLRHAHAVLHYRTMGTSKLGENLIASENGFPPAQGPEWVDIYALHTLHLRVRGLAAPAHCSLDHLA